MQSYLENGPSHLEKITLLPGFFENVEGRKEQQEQQVEGTLWVLSSGLEERQQVTPLPQGTAAALLSWEAQGSLPVLSQERKSVPSSCAQK